MTALRFALAAALVAISAWVVASRRARPDVWSRWFAAKFVALLTSLAAASSASAMGVGPLRPALVVAVVVAWAIAIRLWTTRAWLTRPLAPEVAAAEARRLADAALDEAEAAERGARHGG